MKNSYIIRIRCKNCEIVKKYEVLIGTLVEEYMQATICDNCGCPLSGKKVYT
jgi:formate dehydrogenase maturation protein FdhE